MRTLFLLMAGSLFAQTDVFVMAGSDVVRPGLAAKVNLNIGIGHTFSALKRNPFGDEITFAYTFENAGPGFLHSRYGSHTESIGIMKNFPVYGRLSGYAWPQIGMTTLTGDRTQNRLYGGTSLGAVIKISRHNSIWLQESYNKVATVPWYTTASIGWTISF